MGPRGVVKQPDSLPATPSGPQPTWTSARGAPASPPLRVSVSHLTKSYGNRPAVQDVSFEIDLGITGLLGPNGAGKSTLLRCLAGLATWNAGSVKIDGLDLDRRIADSLRRIGFMPERVAFPSEMRVEEYLRFSAEMKRVPRRQRAESVEMALRRAGLEGARSRIAGNLSKGYRQRLGLAQALLGDPPVLILDEPSAGLDPLNVMDFREVIRDCAEERAVLVSTHVLPEARLLCDRVLVMSGGCVVYDGPTSDMVAADGDGQRFRVRTRSPVDDNQSPEPVVAGSNAKLVHCHRGADRAYVLIVEARSEAAISDLVADLVLRGWSVGAVEPTMDSLEAAFRGAVGGVGHRGGS